MWMSLEANNLIMTNSDQFLKTKAKNGPFSWKSQNFFVCFMYPYTLYIFSIFTLLVINHHLYFLFLRTCNKQWLLVVKMVWKRKICFHFLQKTKNGNGTKVLFSPKTETEFRFHFHFTIFLIFLQRSYGRCSRISNGWIFAKKIK